jgi:hypothetical protein
MSKGDLKIMLLVSISSKGDNYPGNNKSKTNTSGSLHCTNQGPEDRISKNDKMKYNTDESLHCTNLGPEDRIPKGSLHCTNQGPEDRIPRNDIWYKWEPTLYQLRARWPYPEK